MMRVYGWACVSGGKLTGVRVLVCSAGLHVRVGGWGGWRSPVGVQAMAFRCVWLGEVAGVRVCGGGVAGVHLLACRLLAFKCVCGWGGWGSCACVCGVGDISMILHTSAAVTHMHYDQFILAISQKSDLLPHSALLCDRYVRPATAPLIAKLPAAFAIVASCWILPLILLDRRSGMGHFTAFSLALYVCLHTSFCS